MMSSLVATALPLADEATAHDELPLAPWLIGALVLGLLLLLLAFTWTFKRNGAKHDGSMQDGKH